MEFGTNASTNAFIGSRQVTAGYYGDLLIPGLSRLTAPLNVFAFGESNSGGQVANASAASWELLSMSELPFWNVTTEVFDPLDVGTNNNLDHFGLTPGVQHSWELGTANRLREKYIGSRVVRYIQTGQGGSRVTQWNDGGTYWTKFVSRVNASRAAAGSSVNVVWWTLGLNDIVAAVSAATWKPLAIELIGRIKQVIPGVKIYMTELMPNTADKIAYNVVLAEIADADADVVLVSQTGLTTQDANHWDYQSQKDWSLRFIRAMRPLFGNFNTVEWVPTSPATQDASGRLTTTSNVQYAYVSETFQLTDTFAVYSRFTPAGNGLVVSIDTDINQVPWVIDPVDSYLAGWYAVTADLFAVNRNNTPGQTTISGRGRDLVRCSKSGNNLVLATSVDGGTTWVTQRTYTDVLVGLTTCRIKAVSAVANTASVDLWVQR